MHPLRAWLKEQGLTQKQFADRLGVTQATVARFISGARWPDEDTISAIRRETGGEVDAARVWRRNGEAVWPPNV